MPMRRPQTIEELAATATTNTYDPSRPLKDQIRAADNLRKEGKAAHRRGDLEEAFVATARAVTLILERIPKHSQYNSLTTPQKQSLAQNGYDLLQLLDQLKLNVHDKHARWVAEGGDESTDPYEDDQAEYERQQEQEDRSRRERRRAAQDEEARRQDEDMYRRRDAEQRERAFRKRMEEEQELDAQRIAKEQAKVAKQRQAEEYSKASRRRDDELRAQRRIKEDQTFSYVNAAAGNAVGTDYSSRSSYDRGREREPMGPRPMPGQAPISYPAVQPSAMSYVTPPKRDDLDFSSPGPLPLESPNHSQYYLDPRQVDEPSSSREPLRRPSYPPPVTTTSPQLGNQSIEYPRLMSAHQLQQGYRPSTASMFVPHTDPYQQPPQFPSPIPPMAASVSPPSHAHHYASASYPILPKPSSSPNLYYNGPQPLRRQGSNPAMPYLQMGRSTVSPRSSSSARNPMPDPLPPRPPKLPVSPPTRRSFEQQQDWDRAQSAPAAIQEEESSGTEEETPVGLRTVWLPQETLRKFIQIAAINTERKRETCGLLLGRQKRNSFTVQTLLVPRQTSDENSCTMTNEEMIFEFQDKRDLLTLGWIHTHPTQSCFMSSLDLHTHSAFQAMLPEAFAIVCAPRSSPSFGIFRLTDPPGLQVIMSCTNKSNFHPHPDKPIYTDADSGHVQMTDLPLEIADLRIDMF